MPGLEQNQAKGPAKEQPWKAVWPAEGKSSPSDQMFGFKKGEVMVFDGNAGSFFPRGEWEMEQESPRPQEGSKDPKPKGNVFVSWHCMDLLTRQSIVYSLHNDAMTAQPRWQYPE